ncbi:hypothetical protein BSU19_24085, partial [Salmonella enterica subsp. enterica serovar Enteritidis]
GVAGVPWSVWMDELPYSIHWSRITLAQRTDRFGGTTRILPVRPSLAQDTIQNYQLLERKSPTCCTFL